MMAMTLMMDPVLMLATSLKPSHDHPRETGRPTRRPEVTRTAVLMKGRIGLVCPSASIPGNARELGYARQEIMNNPMGGAQAIHTVRKWVL